MPAASPVAKPYGTAAEHLEWAKVRAREYLDQDDGAQGWTSFVSDLTKHPQLAGHQGIELGTLLYLGGHMRTTADVREHIEGCR